VRLLSLPLRISDKPEVQSLQSSESITTDACLFARSDKILFQLFECDLCFVTIIVIWESKTPAIFLTCSMDVLPQPLLYEPF
jgi:hypothetical protein